MARAVFGGGFRVASLCFVLAAVLRLTLLFGTGLYLKRDRTEMASVAVTFARTGQIANPFMAMPTGPTAHVAPLYPMLMGAVYRAFGDGETGETIKQILASFVSSARAPLLVLLVLALGLGEGVALTAGLVSAVYIGAFRTELQGDWEGPLAANVLLLLVLWGYRAAWRRMPGPLERLCYGVGWGVALLTAPALLPVAIGLALLVCASRGCKDPRTVGAALLWPVVGCLLALSPWIIRNYLTLGGFVWGRDNFGLELSVSNGTGANWSNPGNRDRIFSMHPSRNRSAAARLLAQGELAFNADREREAVEWIKSHPREFAALTAQRAAGFWFPPGSNRGHQMALAVFTLLAFVGLNLLWRLGSPAFAITAVIWAMYPVLYYLIQWSSRYRQPIDWSLILCASVVMHEGYSWIRRKRGRRGIAKARVVESEIVRSCASEDSFRNDRSDIQQSALPPVAEHGFAHRRTSG